MDFSVLVVCDEQSHKPGVRIATVRRYVTNSPGWRIQGESHSVVSIPAGVSSS